MVAKIDLMNEPSPRGETGVEHDLFDVLDQ